MLLIQLGARVKGITQWILIFPRVKEQAPPTTESVNQLEVQQWHWGDGL